MNEIENILEKIGLDHKDTKVYLSLLALGPSPIRKIAEKSGINRGTTHMILRSLQSMGIISYYHKERNQHFVAEDPKILTKILLKKKSEIENIEDDLEKIIPKLYSLSQTASRPVVKFYEDYSGIRTILEDALDSTEKSPEKKYVAFHHLP